MATGRRHQKQKTVVASHKDATLSKNLWGLRTKPSGKVCGGDHEALRCSRGKHPFFQDSNFDHDFQCRPRDDVSE